MFAIEKIGLLLRRAASGRSETVTGDGRTVIAQLSMSAHIRRRAAVGSLGQRPCSSAVDQLAFCGRATNSEGHPQLPPELLNELSASALI